MNPFAGMGGLTRNPLGILAIFLGVLYGIAGLLLGSKADVLTHTNQTILTLLIFIFPFVSLGVFGWFVANHHTKLYGPADFRSDSSFLASAKKASAKEIEHKINQEATVIDAGELPQSEIASNASPDGALSIAPAPTEAAKSASERRAIVRGAETQVLGLLESEFDTVQSAVKFETLTGRHVIIDAIGRKADRFALIEVMTIRLRSTFEGRIRDFGLSLLSIDPPVREATKTDILIAVVWIEGRPANVDAAIKRAQVTFKKVGLDRIRIREFTISADGSVATVAT